MIGDGRNYLTALLVPNVDALAKELVIHNAQLPSSEPFHLQAKVCELYQRRVNERLACVSSFEQVRKISLLPGPFTIEAGEMTAKLSLRRKVIEANFAAEIDAMYRK